MLRLEAKGVMPALDKSARVKIRAKMTFPFHNGKVSSVRGDTLRTFCRGGMCITRLSMMEVGGGITLATYCNPS